VEPFTIISLKLDARTTLTFDYLQFVLKKMFECSLNTNTGLEYSFPSLQRGGSPSVPAGSRPLATNYHPYHFSGRTVHAFMRRALETAFRH
jgi:hypothetical protein